MTVPDARPGHHEAENNLPKRLGPGLEHLSELRCQNNCLLSAPFSQILD